MIDIRYKDINTPNDNLMPTISWTTALILTPYSLLYYTN